MGGAVAMFNGWQNVTGSPKWHFFKDGVSLCGRYEESRITRKRDRVCDMTACVNCEKSRKRRAVGGKHA